MDIKELLQCKHVKAEGLEEKDILWVVTKEKRGLVKQQANVVELSMYNAPRDKNRDQDLRKLVDLLLNRDEKGPLFQQRRHLALRGSDRGSFPSRVRISFASPRY